MELEKGLKGLKEGDNSVHGDSWQWKGEQGDGGGAQGRRSNNNKACMKIPEGIPLLYMLI